MARPEQIILMERDAAANSVALDRQILISSCSEKLRPEKESAGVQHRHAPQGDGAAGGVVGFAFVVPRFLQYAAGTWPSLSGILGMIQ